MYFSRSGNINLTSSHAEFSRYVLYAEFIYGSVGGDLTLAMPIIGSSDSLLHLMTPAAMKVLITYVQTVWDNYVYHSFLGKISLTK